MQWQKEEFTVSTDRESFDISVIHQFLSEDAYWCQGIPLETLTRAIENSLCFGLFHQAQQIGFARMITDQATFAYLADVFILPGFRGKKLSKWLITCIQSHPHLQGLRRVTLVTADAQGLYAQFGFTQLKNPERFMEINNPDTYKPLAARPE
ncbi:MAG: GNAT family N-acetyltransferase [Pseudomonadota bacterium]